MATSYEAATDGQLLRMVSRIVSAYVTANSLAAEAVPDLIRDIYQSLDSVRTSSNGFASASKPLKQSVFPDHLVCLEDGLSMKMLKRHLLTVHHLTPAEYRAKWGLPADYPMVASDYAKVRSALAKQSGLGRKPQERDWLERSAQDGEGDRRKRAG